MFKMITINEQKQSQIEEINVWLPRDSEGRDKLGYWG